jgi:hypothetical protein
MSAEAENERVPKADAFWKIIAPALSESTAVGLLVTAKRVQMDGYNKRRLRSAPEPVGK